MKPIVKQILVGVGAVVGLAVVGVSSWNPTSTDFRALARHVRIGHERTKPFCFPFCDVTCSGPIYRKHRGHAASR